MKAVQNFPENLRKLQTDGVRGITLVELMVVITILGLMAGVVTVAVIPRLRTAKKRLTEQEMNAIGKACELFEIDHNTLPESLDELLNPPDDLGTGSYLKDGDLKDGWGNEYEYSIDENGIRLVSFGSDGMEGGSGMAADLVYPKEDDR